MKVKIKKLHKDAKIPIYATGGSVAVDLYAIEEYTINAISDICVIFVSTGI